jgi:2-polyprenyl-3-methyl-5-hydroxy-6-metoxy-1,4-benzoquinol methylase
MTSTTADERFAFGSNWQRFLRVVDEDRVAEATRSLRGFLDVEDLTGRTLLDLGSGSGLFSLAACRLGAERVRSVDVDPQCVACTEELKSRFGDSGTPWLATPGDATDAAFMTGLGSFDIVYSWGVLHHTGQMWMALENACSAVSPRGRLYISLYNDQGLRSRLWRTVKRTYCRIPPSARPLYAIVVMAPRELLSFAAHVAAGNPRGYIRTWTHYKSERGMSRWHDLVDWVGGYPFEVATPAQVFDFCRARGFRLDGMRTAGGGIGCNEFLFTLEA